jgi:hypothetical protein
MTDEKDQAGKEVVSRSVVGGKITEVSLRPEEVTKTKMRKFCFRQPNQQIAVFSLTNNVGQTFELEIDEATVRAMVAVFKGKKPKVKKEKEEITNGEENSVPDAESAESAPD